MTPEIMAASIILAVAAYIDWKEHRVPNWVNFTGLAAAFIFHALLGGIDGVSLAAFGCLTGFATLVVPYALRGMGAGDVKLMMAVGAWLGPWATFQGFVWTVLFGALMGMVSIVRSRQVKERFITVAVAGRNLINMQDLDTGREQDAPQTILLPYGVPIAFGFYSYFIFGGLF